MWGIYTANKQKTQVNKLSITIAELTLTEVIG